MGQYFEAMDFAQKSIALTDKLGNVESKVYSMHALARINKKTKDYEKAFRLLNEALKLAENARLVDAVSYSNKELAIAKMETGKYQEAADILEKSLAQVDSASDSRVKGEVMAQLGQAYLHLGEYEKSQQMLEEAVKLSQAAGDELSFMIYYSMLGKLYLEKGMPQKTVEVCEKSNAWFLSARSADNRMQNAELLAKAYKQLGNYQKALAYYETFMALRDSLVNTENVRVLTAKEKDFEFQLEKNELAIQQAQQEALLKAETNLARTAAAGIAGIALLGFGFFWNARRKNKIISLQNEQLNQLNNTKDRIFSIIGHDLRKPAIAFRGITQKVNYLLKKQDYATLERLGNEIENDALALNQLTDNLLNWALAQKNVMPYKPEALEVAGIVAEEMAIFQKTAAEKKVDLVSNVPASLSVFADANALRVIVRNLIDNAVKYTPEGGRVQVVTEDTKEGVKIVVSDTGVGMPEDKLKDIFLLREGKSEKGTAGEKGAGLGLHLVHELVQLNRGAIEVASRPGQGSRFEVRMPRRLEAA